MSQRVQCEIEGLFRIQIDLALHDHADLASPRRIHGLGVDLWRAQEEPSCGGSPVVDISTLAFGLAS